jgi:hypothetical protein
MILVRRPLRVAHPCPPTFGSRASLSTDLRQSRILVDRPSAVAHPRRPTFSSRASSSTDLQPTVAHPRPRPSAVAHPRPPTSRSRTLFANIQPSQILVRHPKCSIALGTPFDREYGNTKAIPYVGVDEDGADGEGSIGR